MYKYCTCEKCRMFRRDLEFNDKYRIYDIASSSARIQSNTVRAPFPVDKTLWEEAADKLFGIKEGKEMTTVTLDINCNGGLIGANVFYIDEPKFKVGDKVKVIVGDFGSYYAKIEKVESNIHIFKVEKSNKYQRDANTWAYQVRKENNNSVYTVTEKYLVKDDRPEYSKYFDFLDKQGVKLDRDRYTWKSFTQIEKTLYPNYIIASGTYYKRDLRYIAILCDKSTGKDVKFEGAQSNTELLPPISEKC